MRPRARCEDHAWSMLNDKQHEETILVLDVILRLFFVINLRTYGHLRSHDCLAVKASFISSCIQVRVMNTLLYPTSIFSKLGVYRGIPYLLIFAL